MNDFDIDAAVIHGDSSFLSGGEKVAVDPDSSPHEV
jgi:hypothetical protein